MVKVDRSTRAEFGQGATNHKRCVNGDACSGPGCRVTTGKTRDDRRPTASRERVKRWAALPDPDDVSGRETNAQRIARIHAAMGPKDSRGFYRNWSVI